MGLEPPPGDSARLVAVAEITKPHGVAGELRVRLFNEDSDVLARRSRVTLRFPDGSEREERIAAARPVDRGLLVRLPGVDDRTAAEGYRNVILCVRRAELPEPEQGEFYACDVEGAAVETASGEQIGRVTRVVSYPTCDVLQVDRVSGGTVEIPLLEQYVVEVDSPRGVVRVASLEGLEDEPAPKRPPAERRRPRS